MVWRGEKLIEGAVDGLQAIRATGKPLLLLTNNGGYHPDEVVERLAEGGFELDPGEVLTTQHRRPGVDSRQRSSKGAPAFILAPATVAAQLADVLRIDTSRPGRAPRWCSSDGTSSSATPGWRWRPTRSGSGAAFLSLNKDPVMPVENGGMLPGTGSIVAALEAASGGTADRARKAGAADDAGGRRRLGTEKVLMIGDRLESDILGAKRIGWDGALVLTGTVVPGTGSTNPPELRREQPGGVCSELTKTSLRCSLKRIDP